MTARILIVDDATTNIKVLGEGLRTDHQVIFATNGADALRLASTAPRPDLILLDVVMPGMDGYEVCERLKRDDVTRGIPVIFITARSEVDDETRGLELGAVDYITKPFSMAIVRARVRTHLELKRHRDTLARLSQIDGLTGIANRRRFDEVLDLEWRRASRETRGLTLLMIDIDHFKSFNDRYGHLAGDDCIRQVAATLSSTATRAADFVARYGGEEFACLLPGMEPNTVVDFAEKIRMSVEALEIPHAASASGVVTISLGAATVLSGVRLARWEPAALIERADRALYDAKAAGRNRSRCALLEAGPGAEEMH
jgi:diguanylate cyclase (GGDEF)-like protein